MVAGTYGASVGSDDDRAYQKMDEYGGVTSSGASGAGADVDVLRAVRIVWDISSALITAREACRKPADSCILGCRVQFSRGKFGQHSFWKVDAILHLSLRIVQK